MNYINYMLTYPSFRSNSSTFWRSKGNNFFIKVKSKSKMSQSAIHYNLNQSQTLLWKMEQYWEKYLRRQDFFVTMNDSTVFNTVEIFNWYFFVILILKVKNTLWNSQQPNSSPRKSITFRSVDYKDSFLIVLAVAAVFGLVYLLLFFAVRKEPIKDEEF